MAVNGVEILRGLADGPEQLAEAYVGPAHLLARAQLHDGGVSARLAHGLGDELYLLAFGIQNTGYYDLRFHIRTSGHQFSRGNVPCGEGGAPAEGRAPPQRSKLCGDVRGEAHFLPSF